MKSPMNPLEHAGCVMALEDVEPITVEVCELAAMAALEMQTHPRWEAPGPDVLVHRKAFGYQTFTVRKEDQPTGQLVGICFAKRIKDGAADAGMFIHPEHRGGLLALHFARYVQDGMRALGAKWMVWDCDEASGSEALAKRLGHTLISRRYIAQL